MGCGFKSHLAPWYAVVNVQKSQLAGGEGRAGHWLQVSSFMEIYNSLEGYFWGDL